MADTETEGVRKNRLKQKDTGAESFWPAWRRSCQRVTMADRLLCQLTCRQERWCGLLNRLDRDFLHRLMELTFFYLRAISARALYAKRHSTSVNLPSATIGRTSTCPMCPRTLLGTWQKCGREKANVTTEKMCLKHKISNQRWISKERSWIFEITSPGINFTFLYTERNSKLFSHLNQGILILILMWKF